MTRRSVYTFSPLLASHSLLACTQLLDATQILNYDNLPSGAEIYLYLCSIVVHPDYRALAGSKHLYASIAKEAFSFFTELVNSRGVHIHALFGHAASDKGAALCKKFHMDPNGEPVIHGNTKLQCYLVQDSQEYPMKRHLQEIVEYLNNQV